MAQPAACAAWATVLRLPSPPTAITAVSRATAILAASPATCARSAGWQLNSSPFRPCAASADWITARLASRSKAPAAALITNSSVASGSMLGGGSASRWWLPADIGRGWHLSVMPQQIAEDRVLAILAIHAGRVVEYQPVRRAAGDR